MKKRAFFVFVMTMLIITNLFLGCSKGGEDQDGANGAAKADEMKKEHSENKEDFDKPADDLIPVETTNAVSGDISSYILLSSNLETEKMTDVYSRVQGLVEKIHVEEGDFVKKGQLLMQLEPDELALQEARARVDYDQEKNLYERKQAMFDKQLLSKEEFETSKFGLRAKNILWQEAKLSLDHTKITSPISGVVGERLRRPGDRIQPSDKLFTVINNEEMIAVIHVPEKEIGILKKGQKSFIISQHLVGEQFAGWIKRVSPVVDPASGTFKVTVGIKNEADRLRPGMFVNVHIITDTHNDAVLIPKTTLVYENEKMYVFIVRDSLANKIELEQGYQDFEKIEALSGIEVGEKIIIVGQAGLKDKTKVNIIIERETTLKTAN